MTIKPGQIAATKKKSEQLRMSFCKASAKLRNKLFFSMLQQLNRDICYRCGTRILNEDDFSVDHKEPWLDASATLFWDLDNIAFSHRSCNSAASRVPHKIICPVGKNWCNVCKDFLDSDNFGNNRTTLSGKQRYCKSCRKKRKISLSCISIG